GLVANYHFNQGVAGGTNTGATSLTDATGNGFTGTLTNFALTGSTSNWVAPGGVSPTLNYRSVASGDWSSASTWETQIGSCWVSATQAPSAADENITIRSSHTVTVNSVVSTDQTVVEAGGTLTVSSGTLQIEDGTGVDLLVNGAMNFSGSFIESAGQIDVASGGSFTWTNGNMRGSGTTNFLAGSNITLSTGGGSRIIGDTRTINNYGTLVWGSGTNSLLFANSVQFNNYGSFTVSTNASFGLSGSPVAPAFNNMATGIFTKSASFVCTIPGIAFTNSGVVIINDGTLSVSSTTFTNYGGIQVAAGKILDLVSTTTNLNGNTSINGAGIINLNGGTTNIQFLVQIPSGITVNFSSGVIQGANTLRFLNSSTMNWSGGEMKGLAKTEINSGAILNISGTVGLRESHWIENNGTINWNSAGSIVYDGGSSNTEILNNNIFNIGAATNIVNTLGGSNFFTLTNNGTITKTVGTTTLDANVNLVNSGTITVTSGTLTLNNISGTHSGTYNNNSTISGTHAINFTGSTFNNNGFLTSTLAMAGSSAQSISGNGIINNLTINNSNNVSIAVMQRVYGVLTFISGKILAPTSQLDLTETATLIGVSSNRYVAGNVKKRFPAGNSTFTYPVGDANYYTPVVATVYNSAPPCTLEVQSIQGDHPLFASSGLNAIKSVNRFWRIDDGGSGGYDSFDFTFNFDAADVDGGANTSNFTISKFDSPSTWTPVASSGQTATSITATNVTSFSDFQIGEPCTPTNEYRSAVAIGGWNTPGTWETYNGCAWVPAVVAPNGTNSSTITIRSGFNVTNNSQNIQGDEIIIESGATLYVSEGDLTVLDGTGDDLSILGNLQLNGGGEIIINGKVVVADGGSIDCGSQDIFTGAGILEIALNGSMNVFTNGDNFLLSGGVTVNNFGEINWSGPGGDFFMEDAATINNSNIFSAGTNNSFNSTTSGAINNLVGEHLRSQILIPLLLKLTLHGRIPAHLLLKPELLH
nr:hypothetical protein [Bacteroidia bacterium]